ncbi:hypothetical protein CAPN008_11690 [Capnocytophaga canis]|nr:hypothetical protein CAPN008_11690 [Capnocytophaga canis]
MARAQNSNSDVYQFTEVIKVDERLSAKTLFANAKIWFTESFKDPKEVIILDDTQNNILIGRGSIKYNTKIWIGSAAREGYLSFDVNIACKDGRYKYNFTNFTHIGKNSMGIVPTGDEMPHFTGLNAGGGKGYKTKVTKEIKEIIDKKIEPLIESLKIAMDKKLTTQEDNW